MKTPLLDRVVKYLKADDWPLELLPEASSAHSDFVGENGRFHVTFRTREDSEDLTVMVQMDSLVPEERRSTLSEFLTRANYGLVLGNFEMDFSDGEVGYKTSICVKQSLDLLTPAVIEELIYTAVIMMDKHFPAIMSVVQGIQTPAEAMEELEEAERDHEEDDEADEP